MHSSETPSADRDAPILVTGAGGMLGRHLVDVLRAAGYSSLLVPTSAQLDLRDAHAVEEYFERHTPSVVIHLAARLGGIAANIRRQAEFLRDNVLLSTIVIDAARSHGVRKFLTIGSSCMYPQHCPQPMREEMLLTGPLEPTNEGYALAKITALKLCEYYHEQYGMECLTLVAPNLYGPNDCLDPEESHVVAALLLKFHRAKTAGEPQVTLWGTGQARREFLFAADAARALLFALEYCTAGQTYRTYLNIGSGEDVTIEELAERVAQAVGYRGTVAWDPMRPDGMPRKLLESSRMRTLGWRPEVSLRDGIALTYDALRSTAAYEDHPRAARPRRAHRPAKPLRPTPTGGRR